LRSGKFFTLLVAFFLFIPDLLMKVIHVVVVWACVVVFEKIFFDVDGGGEDLETHERF
jgi:hypothetical protein